MKVPNHLDGAKVIHATTNIPSNQFRTVGGIKW